MYASTKCIEKPGQSIFQLLDMYAARRVFECSAGFEFHLQWKLLNFVYQQVNSNICASVIESIWAMFG